MQKSSRPRLEYTDLRAVSLWMADKAKGMDEIFKDLHWEEKKGRGDEQLFPGCRRRKWRHRSGQRYKRNTRTQKPPAEEQAMWLTLERDR